MGKIAKFCLLSLLLTILGSGFSRASDFENLSSEIFSRLAQAHPAVSNWQLVDDDDLASWLQNQAQVDLLEIGNWRERGGQLTVQLEAVAENGSRQRRWFRLRVSATRQVLKARRSLQRGDAVGAADFSPAEVACEDLRGDCPGELDADACYQLTVDLEAGEVLDGRRLRPLRLVKRGEVVQVRLRHNGIFINTRAVAMGSGTLREIITVRNPASRKLYQAQVTGAGQVVVTN